MGTFHPGRPELGRFTLAGINRYEVRGSLVYWDAAAEVDRAVLLHLEREDGKTSAQQHLLLCESVPTKVCEAFFSKIMLGTSGRGSHE